MVKRALTLLTSILFALPLLMPFNIYAQDTAIIVGTDVSLIDSTLVKTETYTQSSGTVTATNVIYTYKVTAQLDNNYVGYLLLKMDYSYYNNPQSGFRTDTGTVTRRVFINGDKAEFNFSITTWYSLDPLLRNTTNATPNVVIQDQGVTLLSELDSIQQIIDILSDLYNSNDQVEGLLNDQLAQLQLVVSNTLLANQYLEKISKFRQWNIPIESVPFVSSLLIYREPFDIYSNGYYSKYPLFYINKSITNVAKLRVKTENTYTFIMYSNAQSIGMLNNFYEFDIPYNISNFSVLNNIIIKYNNYNFGFNLIKFDVKFSNNGDTNLKWKLTNSEFDILMPLYFGFSNNISTEFALQYGLTNKLLDDLDIIANGTAQSSSAVSSNDLANEQLKTDSNTLFSQEDNFKSDMQSAMQNINNSFRLQDMGTKFVSSAQWVRTQYEQLTNNTPFASLITFSLITGLALILLGKVYR